MSMSRGALAATTALGLVIAAAPLYANAETAPARATSYDLSEVVVVATRRSERLQDVPLSVTVIQANDLAAAGVGKSSELATVTPGLNMATSGVYSQPVIRGIGSNVTAPGSEANVATYVDGAYQLSLIGAVLDLPDVESVQVLKGPQGTLFGRNATGGAILINTKAPNLSKPEGTLQASYGNYNSIVVKGFVTAPIIEDKLAFSLTGLYDRTDGYKTDINNGCKDCADVKKYLARAKLRFIPWEGADFTLTALYSRLNDNNNTASPMLGGNNSLADLPGAVVASRPWTYSQNEHSIRKQTSAFTLHGDIEAGPGKISTTTYADYAPSVIEADVDNTGAELGRAKIFARPHSFSQEFLYTTNKIGKFRAVGGVFFFDSKVHNGTIIDQYSLLPPGLILQIYSLDKDRSYAGFGEVNYDVTDQLVLTAGLRYSKEKRQANATVTAGVTAVEQPFVFKPNLQKTWTAWTPRVSALYKVTDHTNVYATFSRGFTGGQYNATSFQIAPANPEHVTAYEIGLKTNEMRNLSLSVAGFYSDYKNLITNVTTFNNGVPTLNVANAAKAKIKGVEVNAQWHATDNLDLTAGGTFIDAKYTKYIGAQVLTPIVTPTGLRGNSLAFPTLIDSRMIRTPKWSGNVTAHYHQDFAQGGLDASSTLYYSSKLFWGYGEKIPQKSYALLQGQIGFRPKGTNLRVSVWGKNLTDHKVISSYVGLNNYDNVDYQPPRTYGVSAQYDF